MVDPAAENPQDLAWALRTFSPVHGSFQERFLLYGAGGMLDPKNYTAEPWALSGGGSIRFWQWDKARWRAFGRGFQTSQTFAFFGVGLLGAVFDPLGLDDDAGLDDIWGDIFDWGVPESKAELKTVMAKATATSSFSYDAEFDQSDRLRIHMIGGPGSMMV